MKLLAILIACLFIIGCEGNKIDLTDYKCNAEQLKLVNIEYDICKESSYITSHCFAQAKKTQCSKVDIESSPLMEAYMEVWEADKKNGHHVISNFIAFYNYQGGTVPDEQGLCENMCREIK